MSAAWDKPIVPIPKPAAKGPQLVPPRKEVPAQAAAGIETAEPHPMITVFIFALIAFTLAFTFFATIVMSLWFRDTGVNWLFQSNHGIM